MFYLVNKPIGYSSFGVLKVLRKKFNLKKIGHTGTLDPLATGLLLVATDNSTKLIPYLEKKDKTYIFSFKIDGKSPTGDLEGEISYFDKKILEEKKRQISKEQIEKIIKDKFSGKIKQTPPIFSAIMIDGQRAYDIARKGQEVKMKEREIEISNIKLINYSFPTITIEATVSAGTYVRVMAEDIGKELGLGGYVILLHRSKIGNIEEKLAISLDDINTIHNLDENYLFPDFGTVEVNENELLDIRNGKELELKGLVENKKYFIVYENKKESLVEIRDSKARIIRNGLS